MERTIKYLSQNCRGLAHFAESAEQYVPVPPSADGSGIGSKPRSKWHYGATLAILLAAPFYVLTGCTDWAAQATADSTRLLEEQPEEALEVLALREVVQDQQDVVVVGRIGGRENPWIENTAAFPIVDRSLTPCNEMTGDSCPTPWDYCCEASLPKATALVMFRDADGQVIKQDPRVMLGVKELQTVFVKGKAKRDEDGNVTILASQIYISEPEKATE